MDILRLMDDALDETRKRMDHDLVVQADWLRRWRGPTDALEFRTVAATFIDGTRWQHMVARDPAVMFPLVVTFDRVTCERQLVLEVGLSGARP